MCQLRAQIADQNALWRTGVNICITTDAQGKHAVGLSHTLQGRYVQSCETKRVARSEGESHWEHQDLAGGIKHSVNNSNRNI